MSILKAIPKPLANAKYTPKTLNLYKKTIRDSSRNGEIRELGWEDPSVRIASTITWLLRNAKKQGLTMSNDGSVPVQQLLQHPRLATLDFSAVERAVHSFRSHQLKLTYAPRNVPGSTLGSQVACWWIGLQPTIHEQYSDQRVINIDEVPGLIYKASPEAWPTLQTRGISRGSGPPISFSTRTELPLHYQGDHTFTRLDTTKVLTQSDIKLYRSVVVNPKRGNESIETVTSPASNIPPSMFQSTTRIAIERFPLILRETPNAAEDAKKRRKRQIKKAKAPGKVVVMQAGVDALSRFGYGHILDNSSLLLMLKTQREEREQEREREKTSVGLNEDGRVDSKKANVKTRKKALPSRSASKTRQRTKDALPHMTITRSQPPPP